MPDVFTKQKRSEVMSRIRARGNKETEIALMKIFRRHKITGWRRQTLLKFKIQKVELKMKKAGHAKACTPNKGSFAATIRPDFIFPKQKLVVLVDGCFWHGCPKHSNLPVTNRAFWRKKLIGNRTRDRLVNRTLRQHGWRVIRIWQHDLKHEQRCLRRIIGGKRGLED
jgi:DNA mismatch endonuclease, patch repair protein